MDLLYALLDRKVIVALAVIGAVIATVGSMMAGREEVSSNKRARVMLRTGYGIAGLSVLLFIVAGFVARN